MKVETPKRGRLREHAKAVTRLRRCGPERDARTEPARSDPCPRYFAQVSFSPVIRPNTGRSAECSRASAMK